MNSVAMFAARLRTSNNFRLELLWLLIVGHLVFNLFFVGFNPRPIESSVSETQQRYYNEYFHGKYITDQELNPPPSGFVVWFRSFSWRLWLIELIAGIIYFPIALREEVGRAWQHARERTHTWRDAPDQPVPVIVGTPTTTVANAPIRTRRDDTFRQAWIFIREFAASIIAEILGERVVR